MKEKPWPIYKVKVGTADDIEIVKAMRENTDAVLRVDANAAWDVETALKLIPQLKELGVEFIEQPLAKDNWEGMKIFIKSHHFHYLLMKLVYLKAMLKNAKIIFTASI